MISYRSIQQKRRGLDAKEACKIVEVPVKFEDREMCLELISTHGFNEINPGNHKDYIKVISDKGLNPVQLSESISIVIGSDYFYRFVTGSSLKFSNSASLDYFWLDITW